MPVDLDLTPQAFQGGGGAATNPLGAISSITELRTKMLQQQQFQNELTARQRFGQYMATAPTIEDGLAQAQKDPLVAGYAPELYNTYTQGKLLNTQIAGEQQKQAIDGLGVIHKAIAASDNPAQVNSMIDAGMATLSPTAKAAAQSAIPSIKQALLPQGDQTDPAVYARNRAALGLATATLDPSALEFLYGKPGVANTGNALVPTIQAGPLGGGAGGALAPGSLSVGPTSIPVGAPPRSEITSGGGSVVVPAVPGASASPGASVSPAPGSTALASQIPTTGIPSGSSASPGASPPPLSFTGKPLPAPDSALPKVPLGTNGLPIRTPNQQASVDQLVKTFNEASPQYDMAAQTSARLDNVKDDIQTLAKGGGWMTPGFGGPLRASLGNAINTIDSIFNPEDKSPPVDIAKLAAGQETMKETNTLGFSLAHQMFGGGREPLGIVTDAISAVPGIDNSPLGGMLVSDMLKAGAQWQLDQRTYKQDWLARTGGDLTGADTQFAQDHPPSEYMKKVMDQYGLGPNGFTSPQAVRSAVSDHLMTTKMAYDQMLRQKMISQKVYDAAQANGFVPPGGAK